MHSTNTLQAFFEIITCTLSTFMRAYSVYAIQNNYTCIIIFAYACINSIGRIHNFLLLSSVFVGNGPLLIVLLRDLQIHQDCFNSPCMPPCTTLFTVTSFWIMWSLLYCHHGYKMQFKVDTNGEGSEKGSHVCVFAYLMKGSMTALSSGLSVLMY